jgi:precorrin-3B C17-methyltransferase/precorrin-6y C5,15-methyltransferase (decarboxylating) CbiE subunit/precorrin-6Y C5,15-methyltransferase (decarboxylating) CbiT subunit
MTVHLVAAGPGDPGLWTVRVEDLLAAAPVVVCDRDLAEVVTPLAGGTVVVVDDDEAAADELVARAGEGDVVRIAAGDRVVWAGGGAEAARLREAGIPYSVEPTVVAAFAEPAGRGVPVMTRQSAATLTVALGTDPEPAPATGTVVRLVDARDTRPVVTGAVASLDLTARSPDGIVHVIGLLGGAPVGPEAEAALASARTVIGSRDQLDAAHTWLAPDAEQLELGRGLTGLDRLDGRPGPVCVLASGDPGFFGIVRALGARVTPDRLRVHPAPSSVSLAFARLGLPWDDAVVVSAHARALDTVVPVVRGAPVAAVLTSPDNPPEALGKALVTAGCGHRRVAVCSHLGETGEQVTGTDLAGLAGGVFDARSVVVVEAPEPARAGRPVSWGRDTATFAHRASMITKPEVRAAVLGRLDLPAAGVLWDLGAGSGSVAIEAALAAPGLRVIAVERRPDDAARIRANAAAAGALVEVVEGDAVALASSLPLPDRVFVGGGGLAALDAARAALAPGGRIVATFAAADRATEAYRRLGHLVQVGVDRAETLPDGGVRFVADNPVFVAWGPDVPARTGRRGAVVVGVGCSSMATGDETRALAEDALTDLGLRLADVDLVATVDRRETHPAVTGLARPVQAFAAGELARIEVPHPSAVVEAAVGTPSVAEAAALLAAGPGAQLAIGKRAGPTATVAVAFASEPQAGGALAVVGLGPGDGRHRTPAAIEAVRAAEVVVGYEPYVEQAADLLRPDQAVLRSGMGDEAARATEAVRRAAGGERVVIVSSGDPGVFAMASVTLEIAAEVAPDLPVTVVPGVSAGQAAAALAGAPLAHDHAVISLSDRLTPWPVIEERLRAAAAADLAVALYNPRSRGRPDHLERARALLLAHRAAATPVVVVTGAARPGESVTTTTLAGLDVSLVGMGSIVLVGSSATDVLADRVVTRRHHPRPEVTP